MNTSANISVGMAVVRSSDGGASWTNPRVLSELGADVVQRISPGRGLELGPRSKWAGRLLFMAQMTTNVGNVILFSDGGGKTFVKSRTVV